VDEEWVQQFGDFLLVGKIESSFEWNPNTLEMHRTNFDYVSHFLAFEDAISTSSGHSSDIEELCAVDHMVICRLSQQMSSGTRTFDRTFSPSNTDTLGLDLEAKASFIFPQSRSDSRLHACWSDLTRGIHVLRLGVLRARDWSLARRQLSTRSHCCQQSVEKSRIQIQRTGQRKQMSVHLTAHWRRDWVSCRLR
jgi:hypothetical protein